MPFVIPLCKQPASSPGVKATGAGSICNKWAIKRQARSKRLASLRHGRLLSTAGLHSEHRSTVAILLNSQQAPFNGQLPSRRAPTDVHQTHVATKCQEVSIAAASAVNRTCPIVWGSGSPTMGLSLTARGVRRLRMLRAAFRSSLIRIATEISSQPSRGRTLILFRLLQRS